MRDGESTAAFLAEMFGDCGIEDAIEVEMHLFAALRKEISSQKAKRVEAESRCDRLEKELSRYKQGVEIGGKISCLHEVLAPNCVKVSVTLNPDEFKIGQHVRVLVMKEGTDE